MPFKKTYRRKNYRKTYRKKNNTLATKKYVKKQISKDIETKYFDIQRPSDDIDYSGRIDRLTGVSQGTTDSTRIGDKLTMRSLRISYEATVADSTNMVRFIIVQWFPNSTLLAPTSSYVLSTIGSALAPQSPYIHDYKNQFNVLYDKVHILSTDYPRIVRKFWLKMKWAKKVINFSAGTSEGSNHLYMIRISDSSAVTHPTSNILTRLNYDDA